MESKVQFMVGQVTIIMLNLTEEADFIGISVQAQVVHYGNTK